MVPFEVLDTSRAEFERRLRAVGPRDWGRPTPCTEWTVEQLVNHVVGGNGRYRMLLDGADADTVDATRALDHLGDDPVGSFCRLADEMTAAFREPDALDRTVHHPAGDRSGAELLFMRVLDLAVHGWDLARAIRADEVIDPEVVDFLWERLSVTGTNSRPGSYAEAGAAPADGASLQERLLQLTGRSP